MLNHGAWPPLDPKSWKILAKKLWKAALENPIAARLVAPPIPGTASLMVVGVHPTLRVALTLAQMKNTICNKRSHVLGKAKNIMMELYGLDLVRMDAQEIKSVITWLVHDFRFMHQDCVVRTVATTPTVANMTLEAGSAILKCCDH